MVRRISGLDCECVCSIWFAFIEWSCSDMVSSLCIPKEELKRQLLSLATPKHRVLLRTGKTPKDVDDDEVFSVNPDFSSTSMKVKVQYLRMVSARFALCPCAVSDPIGEVDSSRQPQTTTKGAGGRHDSRHVGSTAEIHVWFLNCFRSCCIDSHGAAVTDRIEAAVTRVIKPKRTMKHADLVAAVIAEVSCKFVPTPQVSCCNVVN